MSTSTLPPHLSHLPRVPRVFPISPPPSSDSLHDSSPLYGSLQNLRMSRVLGSPEPIRNCGEDIRTPSVSTSMCLSGSSQSGGQGMKKSASNWSFHSERSLESEVSMVGKGKMEIRLPMGGVEDVKVISNVGWAEYNPNKVNQDRCIAVPGLNQTDSMFAVFDGHGYHGHRVAEFVAEKLRKKAEEMCGLDENALTNLFHWVNEELFASSVNTKFSGCTGNVCVLDQNRLICANIGDSRAVLGIQVGDKIVAKALSVDHKPDREDEKRRIESRGGRVELNPLHPLNPSRVYLLHDDAPGLAISRSFGDEVGATCGIIATPELTVHSLVGNERYLVIASDGVWELLSCQEVIDMISILNSCQENCERIVSEAADRWKGRETKDDISCVVVQLTSNARSLDRKRMQGRSFSLNEPY